MPSNIIKFLVAILIMMATINHVKCLQFNFSSFPPWVENQFNQYGRSGINDKAFQVTLDVSGQSIFNLSGRIIYGKSFKLWRKHTVASFNSTFVLNITPKEEGGGEGLAFILAKDDEVPNNSMGQWLGIVNASTNGSSSSNIVAIEFDTKKSFAEDLDSNHVGLDINSVYSEKQVSLNSSGITIADGSDYTAMIIYDGVAKVVNVSIFKGNVTIPNNTVPIISQNLDLSQHLPSQISVGFSASTGTGTELNCVKSWYFDSTDLDESMPLWIWIVIPILVLILLSSVFGGYLYLRAKSREKQVQDDFNIQNIETGLGPKKFKLRTLKSSTGNFNPKNELGRGGFGIVYKGIVGEKEVAVKRIINTAEGKQNLIAEVTTIGSLHHKNLVQLIGWCYESHEFLLVYEYMPNGSLDMLIHPDDEASWSILSWEKRHNIISGVAQALDYLHHECTKRVLHRDIKTSNIMLDSELNARLGDFGLARMFKLTEKTHHTTKELVGTPGYMAPEIFHMGRTTAETDVYAFGVLVLVVATGRKPGKQDGNVVSNRSSNNIVDWVWEHYKSETVVKAVDPKLKGDFDKEKVECMLVLGLACCHPNPYMRPSMRNALQVLMGEAVPPSVPLEKPAFMWPVNLPSLSIEDSFGEEMMSSATGR